jgi:type IX secretion system PorP/SprF family membrane protein
MQAQHGTPMVQYSGNQIVYNPGYAGIYDLFSANLGIRQTWFGIRQAPSLITFNGHAPFNNQQHALGFVFQREQQGPLIGNYGYANYAHKVNFGESMLSLGLQAGFFNSVIDWTLIGRENVTDPEDPGLGDGRTSITNLDVNFGAYFQVHAFYAGLSVKHLTTPRFGQITHGETGEDWASQKRMHFFLIAGYHHEISEQWALRPEMLMRYVHTVPTSVNIGVHVSFENKYFIGVALQTGQRAVCFTGRININPQLKIGYTYDVYYGKIRPFQRGSHEVSVNYFMRLWERDESKVSLLWL